MINKFIDGPFRNYFYDDERKILDLPWHETDFILQALCLTWTKQNFAHHQDFMQDDNPNIPNVFVDTNSNPLKGSDMLEMWEQSWRFIPTDEHTFQQANDPSFLKPISESDPQNMRIKIDANVTYSSLMDAWGDDIANQNLETFNRNDRVIKTFQLTAPPTNNSTQVRVTGGTVFIGDVTVHNNGTQQTATVTNSMWSETPTTPTTTKHINNNNNNTYDGIGAKLRGIGAKLAANAAEVARHIVADDLT
jgi:hypothetical protein